MIDLKNTYIENDNPELLDIYLHMAIEQGFTVDFPWETDCDDKFALCMSRHNAVQSDVIASGKQITLADLKPNAKPFLQTGEAFEHTKTLNFILERMINVHGEHESVDYIHKLRNAIMFVERAEEPANMAGPGVKPKRTKVAYVKCEFDKLSEAFAEHEASPLYNESGALLDTPMVDRGLVDTFHGGYQIYRKVDREVTWQEEVKRHIDENSDIYEIELSSSHVLVNMEISNKNFIAMCRAVASMTDKPE